MVKMKTIKPTYEKSCPDCKLVSETETEMCPKHWDEIQHAIAAIHADGDLAMEEALYRLLAGEDE